MILFKKHCSEAFCKGLKLESLVSNKKKKLKQTKYIYIYIYMNCILKDIPIVSEDLFTEMY